MGLKDPVSNFAGMNLNITRPNVSTNPSLTQTLKRNTFSQKKLSFDSSQNCCFSPLCKLLYSLYINNHQESVRQATCVPPPLLILVLLKVNFALSIRKYTVHLPFYLSQLSLLLRAVNKVCLKLSIKDSVETNKMVGELYISL